jgi:hypothetical protein
MGRGSFSMKSFLQESNGNSGTITWVDAESREQSAVKIQIHFDYVRLGNWDRILRCIKNNEWAPLNSYLDLGKLSIIPQLKKTVHHWVH